MLQSWHLGGYYARRFVPRIFDNIEADLLGALRDILQASKRADFGVGYFNLRGWSSLADLADAYPGADEECCRVLIGMHRPPEEVMRETQKASRQEQEPAKGDLKRLRRRMVRSLKEQIEFAFQAAVCDDFHVLNWSFEDFPIGLDSVPAGARKRLLAIVPKREEAMAEATQFKLNAGRRVGNYNLAKCRHVTHESDRIFAEALGLIHVWEDIELYCVQVVKTNFGADEDDE